MTKYILLTLFALVGTIAMAQDLDPVSWEFKVTKTKQGPVLIFEAVIEEGWYLYAQDIEEGGPIPTSFYFDDPTLNELNLTEVSKYSINTYDEMFAMPLKKYKKTVCFKTTEKLSNTSEKITGTLEYMCCDGTQCLAPKTIEFTFNLKK